MGIIKQHYKKIISIGLIIFGLIILIIIIVVRPTKTIFKEVYNYNQPPTLTNIDFPFSQDIQISSSDLSFLEIRFEDDSINQYQYTITITHNSDILFEHTYIDEKSNIIRLPLDTKNLKNNDIITFNINCLTSCKNAKINLYETEDGKHPKVLLVYHKSDISLFWYSIFPIALGLTLIPLSGEKK